MVGRVETERRLPPRVFEVHVPAEKLAVTSPVHVHGVRRTPLVEHQPASVPVSFLVSPITFLELGDSHARAPARPPDRRAGSDPENGSRRRMLDHYRRYRAENPPGPDKPKEHLIWGWFHTPSEWYVLAREEIFVTGSRQYGCGDADGGARPPPEGLVAGRPGSRREGAGNPGVEPGGGVVVPARLAPLQLVPP